MAKKKERKHETIGGKKESEEKIIYKEREIKNITEHLT